MDMRSSPAVRSDLLLAETFCTFVSEGRTSGGKMFRSLPPLALGGISEVITVTVHFAFQTAELGWARLVARDNRSGTVGKTLAGFADWLTLPRPTDSLRKRRNFDGVVNAPPGRAWFSE